MPKIKEVYEYNNGSWENGTPIGADASNVDVALSDSTSTRDLQSVLGNVSVSDPSIKTQLTGKVNSNSGDIKDTVVSVLDPSSATDTSENIDSTDVIVAAGESQYTMWSKFNTFRKRVSNKFNNFLISSVEDVVTPSSTKTYSQAALNSYFADVIGYKTDADVASIGSVADQLSTLNNNLNEHNINYAFSYTRTDIRNYTTNQWNTFYLYDNSSSNVSMHHYYFSQTTKDTGPAAYTESNSLFLKPGVWIISFNWTATQVSNPTTSSQWYLRTLYVNPATSTEAEIWKTGSVVASTGTGGNMILSIIASEANNLDTPLRFSIFVGNNSWLVQSMIRIRGVRLTNNLPIPLNN